MCRQKNACRLPIDGFLLGLLFDTENGGDKFLRNLSQFTRHYNPQVSSLNIEMDLEFSTA
jgi:hypothetical protein